MTNDTTPPSSASGQIQEQQQQIAITEEEKKREAELDEINRKFVEKERLRQREEEKKKLRQDQEKPRILLLGIKHLASHILYDCRSIAKFTVVDQKDPELIFKNPLIEHEGPPKSEVNRLQFSRLDMERNLEKLLRTERFDFIINTICVHDPIYSATNPADTYETNVMYTQAMMNAILNSNTNARLVQLSSDKIYGDQGVPSGVGADGKMDEGAFADKYRQQFMISEDDRPNPKGIRAITRYLQEVTVKQNCDTYGLPYIILRVSNTFGRHTAKTNVWNQMIADAFNTHTVNVFGDKYACLPAGEQIFANPHPKQIQEFKVGDKVLTRSGFGKVTAAMNRDYDGQMYEFKAQGQLPFKTTEEHPILVKRLHTECRFGQTHRCKDKCWCEKYHKDRMHEINTEIKWVPARDVNITDYLIVSRLKGGSKQCINLSEFIKRREASKREQIIELNEDWCYILGLFIADGWTSIDKGGESRHRQITIALNMDKDLRTRDRLTCALDKLSIPFRIENICSAFGSSRGRIDKPNVWYIKFSHTWLARWLDKHVGKKTTEKRIPGIVFDLPTNETESFIDGLIDGDGCYDEYGTKITSTSKILLQQIQVLATKIGKWGSISWRERGNLCCILGKTVIRKPVGYIEINNERRTRHWIDDDYIYIPITSKRSFKFTGRVYNIETEPDHTFCMPSIVHNSRDFVNIEEVAHFIKRLCVTEFDPSGWNDVYNIGGCSKTRQFIDGIAMFMQTMVSGSGVRGLDPQLEHYLLPYGTVRIKYQPPRCYEDSEEAAIRLWLDCKKAKEKLKYDPTLGMEWDIQIKETFTWVMAYIMGWPMEKIQAAKSHLQG